MSKRRIEIKVDTKHNADLDELKEFQGSLKESSDIDIAKLKREIVNTGYAFPIRAWKDPKRKSTWIIGGHQTARALRELRDEGYDVPRIPIVLIDAKNKLEAKRRVLQDVAQFGKIQNEGLKDFINDSGLKFDDIFDSFSLPDFDIMAFGQVYFPDSIKEDINFTASKNKKGAQEINEEDFEDFDHECPKCSFKWDDK